MKALTIRRSKNGENTFAAPAPDFVNAYTLAADTFVTFAVPEGAGTVMFSALADFYVAYDANASVPTTNVTDGSASELNPTVRSVTDLNAISLISPTNDNIVTLSFYA